MNRFLFFCRVALLLALTSRVPVAAQAPNSTYRFEWAQVQYQQTLNFRAGVLQPMATDSQGNVYVIGLLYSGQSAQIDTITVTNSSPHIYSVECYLAKLNQDGRVQWVRQARPTAGSVYSNYTVAGVTADKLGNVFVHGICDPEMNFGGLQLPWTGTPQSASIGYLAKFDTHGQGQWVRELPMLAQGHGSDYIFDLKKIAPDNLGNCLLVGNTWNTDSIGTLPFTNLDANTAFVAKVGGAAGTFEWVRQARGEALTFPVNGQNNALIGTAVAADPAGNVFLGGAFGDTLRFSATQYLVAGTDSTGDGYVAKYNPNGQLLWTRQIVSPAVRGASVYLTALAIDFLGNVFVGGSTRTDSWTGTVTTFSGLTFSGAGKFLAKLDAGGTGQWVRSDNARENDVWITEIAVDADGNSAAAGRGYGWSSGRLNSYDLFAARYAADGRNLGVVQSGPSPLYNAKGAMAAAFGPSGRELFMYVYVDSADVLGTLPINVSGPALVLTKVNLQAANAYLGGSVYLDQNTNGRRDPAELPFPSQVWVEDSASGQVLVHYADAPTYGHDVAPGAYSLRARHARPYYQTTQPAGGAHRVAVPTAGLRADTLTFGLAPIPGMNDLRITLTPYTPARPGRVCRYRVSLHNVGTSTLSGAVTATFTALGTLLSTAPAPTSQQGQTLTWNFQNLPPFAARAYDFAISLPTNLTAGTRLISTATVTPISGDQTPLDNLDTAEQTVITSWDPNDLTVNFSQLTTAQIGAGQPLDYTVRFENYGTDTAFAVIIQDTLPAALLQLHTLELVGQSHNCRWTLTPAGLLTLRFPGIALPCQSTNAFFSQGFVRFRVVPRTTLVGGQHIPNRAHIVFDYNAPLATNQATTVVTAPAGLLAATPARAGWAFHPNPTSRRLTLTGLELAAPTTLRVRLLDAVGRSVRTLSVTAPAGALQQPLELADLAPGFYFLELTVPGQAPTRQRLVVEAAR